MKEQVVISRKWDNPEINIKVTDKDISISMTLDDFMGAVTQEVGSPTFMVTTEQLRKKLKLSALNVCAENKKLTAQVM